MTKLTVINLILSFWLSVLSFEYSFASFSCSELFSEVLAEEVTLDSDHLEDYRHSKKRPFTQLEMDDPLNNPLHPYYKVKGEETYLELNETYYNRGLLEMLEPFGRRRYFKTPNDGSNRYVEVSKPDDLNVKETLPENLKQIPRNYEISSRENLLLALVAQQAVASNTLRKSLPSESKLNNNLRLANEKMLEFLDSKKELTLKDIETLNSLLIEGVLVSSVLRGSPPRWIHRNGKKHYVDNSQKDVGSSVDGYIIFQYLPVENVISHLKQLLIRINGVGRSSSLKDIIAIYRDFIVIHPFLDGNGRTAKVLVDYLMLKAGFPPVSHSYFLTQEVIYNDIDGIYQNFLKSYNHIY